MHYLVREADTDEWTDVDACDEEEAVERWFLQQVDGDPVPVNSLAELRRTGEAEKDALRYEVTVRWDPVITVYPA